jgi:hypothetical protein
MSGRRHAFYISLQLMRTRTLCAEHTLFTALTVSELLLHMVAHVADYRAGRRHEPA